MIVKGDVLAAMKGGMKPQSRLPEAGSPAKSAGAKKDEKAKGADTPLTFEDIPNSPIRKVRNRHFSHGNCLAIGSRLSWSYFLRTFLDP